MVPEGYVFLIGPRREVIQVNSPLVTITPVNACNEERKESSVTAVQSPHTEKPGTGMHGYLGQKLQVNKDLQYGLEKGVRFS